MPIKPSTLSARQHIFFICDPPRGAPPRAAPRTDLAPTRGGNATRSLLAQNSNPSSTACRRGCHCRRRQGSLFQQRRRGTLSSAAAKHSHHQQKHTKKQSEGGMGGIVIEHVYYYIHHQQIIHITTIPTKTKIKQRLGVKKRKTEIVIDRSCTLLHTHAPAVPNTTFKLSAVNVEDAVPAVVRASDGEVLQSYL